MNSKNDGTPTELYLVRLWKRKLGDGTVDLHGKLQHVVSGASCHFDALPDLPGALEKMMDQAASSPGPDVQEASLG